MKVKTFAFPIISAMAILTFMGCNFDNNNLVSLFSRATVVPLDDNTFSLTLDDNSRLWIASSYVSQYQPKVNQRAFINYSILPDKPMDNYSYSILLYGIADILTKQVADLTVNNAEEIGNDPIKIYDIRLTREYLNVDYEYHNASSIDLVNNTMANNPDDGKIYLELRYSNNEGQQTPGERSSVCFYLDPFWNDETSSLTFVIKTNQQEGEYSYELELENT